jgi:hypothetical protein
MCTVTQGMCCYMFCKCMRYNRNVLESFAVTCSKACHPSQHLPFLPFIAMQWEPDGLPVWQQVAEV